MDPADMMEKMDDMKDDIEELEGKIDAIAKYLKMAFKYNPDSFEMVKPEEVAGTPMSVR